MEVEQKGECAVVIMRRGENKITSEFIQSFHEALDTVKDLADVTHLVTIGEGKFYSTGVDVGVVRSPSNHRKFLELLSGLQKLLARLLTFPLVTVAAINGHCVGGGAMLALAHDYRVMREDRGWFFVPIVKLGHTLPEGLLELAKSKVPQPAVHQMIITARHFSAAAGKEAGFIHQVSTQDGLTDAARKLGAESAKSIERGILGTIKCDMYHDLCGVLTQQAPNQFQSHL